MRKFEIPVLIPLDFRNSGPSKSLSEARERIPTVTIVANSLEEAIQRVNSIDNLEKENKGYKKMIEEIEKVIDKKDKLWEMHLKIFREN